MNAIGFDELGYDRKLYILAFDHRGSFEKMVGGDHDKVAGAKRLIWEGFQVAVEFVGISPEHQKQLETYLKKVR